MQMDDGMAFGDVDGDGRTDVVRLDYADNSSADIEVALGTDQGFVVHDQFTWDAQAARCVSPELGDVDGDGDLDVFVACDQGSSQDDDDVSYYVWKNDGSGNFSQGDRHAWDLRDSHDVGDAELAELDGDGDLDVAVVATENIILGENDGSGRFHDHHYVNENCRDLYQVEVAQMEAGGHPELIVTGEYWCDGGGRVEVWGVRDSVRLGSQIDSNLMSPSQNAPHGLGIADLDADGNDDAAILDVNTGELLLFEGDGQGDLNMRSRNSHLTQPPDYRWTNEPQFADMDGDGHLDIVAGTRDNGRIVIHWTDGSFGLTDRSDVELPSSRYPGSVSGVFVEDWDGNGDDDVLIAGEGGRVGVGY